MGGGVASEEPAALPGALLLAEAVVAVRAVAAEALVSGVLLAALAMGGGLDAARAVAGETSAAAGAGVSDAGLVLSWASRFGGRASSAHVARMAAHLERSAGDVSTLRNVCNCSTKTSSARAASPTSSDT